MDNILEIKHLVIHYRTVDGLVEAVNDVNLEIKRGAALGLEGETGAGKTTLAKGILQLIQMPPGEICSGEILYNNEDLLKKNNHGMMAIRGKQISMIFQDPMTSLNPVMTVGDQIAEVLIQHEHLSKGDAAKRAGELLEMVGIPAERMHEYAHQFSGGMKQRVVIAIALACNPMFLIADEPTTALDVTIQAQLLELIADLRKKLGTSMLLITHDLGVVAQNCDYVAIMYAGEIVEVGTLHDIFKRTMHPYTIGLFESIPKLNEDVTRLKPIDGLMPDPTKLPKGCKFCDRCKLATQRCFEEHPQMLSVDGKEHQVRCFLCEEETVKGGGSDGE